jgi:hypothetical protein
VAICTRGRDCFVATNAPRYDTILGTLGEPWWKCQGFIKGSGYFHNPGSVLLFVGLPVPALPQPSPNQNPIWGGGPFTPRSGAWRGSVPSPFSAKMGRGWGRARPGQGHGKPLYKWILQEILYFKTARFWRPGSQPYPWLISPALPLRGGKWKAKLGGGALLRRPISSFR